MDRSEVSRPRVLLLPDLLDEVFMHVARRDLVRLATVHSTWQAAVYRRLHRSLDFASPGAARRFLLSHRPDDEGALVSGVTKARAIVCALTITGATVALLPELVDACPILSSLTLQADAVVADKVLADVLARLPTLRDLRLRGAITSPGPPNPLLSPSDALLQAFNTPLRTLELGGKADVSDAGLLPLLRACGAGLRALEIGDCPKLTARSLRAVAAQCPDLEELILRRASACLQDRAQPNGEDEAARLHPLEAIARGCRHLRKLVLSELYSPLPSIPCLADLADLNTLSLTRASFRPSFLAAFGHLRHLTISSCRVVGSGEDVVTLPVASWSKLESISLLSLGVTVGEMRQLLAAAPRLRKVALDGISPSSGFYLSSAARLPSPPASPTRGILGGNENPWALLSRPASPLERQLAAHCDEHVLSASVPNDVVITLFSSTFAPSLESLALFGFVWQHEPPVRPPRERDEDGNFTSLATRPLKAIAKLGFDGRFCLAVVWALVGAWFCFRPPPFLIPWATSTSAANNGSRASSSAAGLATAGSQNRRIVAEGRLLPDDVVALKRRNPNLVKVWV